MVNVWMSNKMLHWPDASICINFDIKSPQWYHQFNANQRLGVSCVSRHNPNLKKTHPCFVGKMEGLVTLLSPLSCMPHHIDWMAGEQLFKEHETHLYTKQWGEQLHSLSLAWITNQYHEAHMPAMGILQRVVVEQTWWLNPQMVKQQPH